MTTICQICGQEFYTKKSRIKNGRGKFCSRRCDAFSKTKSYNFDQGFGRRLRYSGYIERNDPKTRRRRKEHVWIAEEVLGRKLIKPEEVHHIDGIRRIIKTQIFWFALNHITNGFTRTWL